MKIIIGENKSYPDYEFSVIRDSDIEINKEARP